MALMKQEKEALVKRFSRGGLDTGSPEVQIAILSERILRLTDHFKTHDKDNHGRRGMFKLVSQRRSLLTYLRRVNPEKYTKLIEDLKLRK
jgi:small subunit ribosomal protein S15